MDGRGLNQPFKNIVKSPNRHFHITEVPFGLLILRQAPSRQSGVPAPPAEANCRYGRSAWEVKDVTKIFPHQSLPIKNPPTVVVNWKFSKPQATTKKPLFFSDSEAKWNEPPLPWFEGIMLESLKLNDLVIEPLSCFPSHASKIGSSCFILQLRLWQLKEQTLKQKLEDSLRFQQNLSKCTQSSRKDLRA